MEEDFSLICEFLLPYMMEKLSCVTLRLSDCVSIIVGMSDKLLGRYQTKQYDILHIR